MIVIRALILFSCIVTLSCGSKKIVTSNNCILDSATNTISGPDIRAKEFYRKRLFIPRVLEELSLGRKKIYYSHFSDHAQEEYARYHIYGCRDTTWAKQRMVEHIMEKYHVYKYDSIYYDTIYTVQVVDESKLVKSHEPCDRSMSHFNRINGMFLHIYQCLEWNLVAHLMLPPEFNENTNSVEYNMRSGRHDISVPVYLASTKGFDVYQQYILDSLGIHIAPLRIDTIPLGVYEYNYKN